MSRSMAAAPTCVMTTAGRARCSSPTCKHMLDTIEQRVSTVLGVPGAPDSFDHPDVLKLLIDLARMGTAARYLLAPLALDEAKSINIESTPNTGSSPWNWCTPAGPGPEAGQAVRPRREPTAARSGVRPGIDEEGLPVRLLGVASLHRPHRLVGGVATEPARGAEPPTAPAYSVLYAATDIADDDAAGPQTQRQCPSGGPRRCSHPVTRVTSWTGVARGRAN